MEPFSALAGLGPIAGLLGGGTKVSQSSSNVSYSSISANISGISGNPTTGSQTATQSAPSAAVASSQPNAGGNLLDSILASAAGGGSGTYTGVEEGPLIGITTPETGILSSPSMLAILGGLGALAVAVWFFLKKGK